MTVSGNNLDNVIVIENGKVIQGGKDWNPHSGISPHIEPIVVTPPIGELNFFLMFMVFLFVIGFFIAKIIGFFQKIGWVK